MKIKVRICPECRKPYAEPPALSRKDNKTWICPRCGSVQALMDAGYTRKQAEETTDDIRRACRELQRRANA